MTKQTTIIEQFVSDLQDKLVVEQKLLLEAMTRHSRTKDTRDKMTPAQFENRILTYEIQMVEYTNNIKAIEKTIGTIQTF